MDAFTLENLSFTYPGQIRPALDNISFSVPEGCFLTLCGASASGKTTLLRQLKPALAPHGTASGRKLFYGRELSALSARAQAAEIGFVQQNPDAQLVTDQVWHELAFGLESLGCPGDTIRVRVAEMASFFGLEDQFESDTHRLSGGQKQLLNLAAVLILQPKILLLDEPTSQLDPIAAREFLSALTRVNRELGVTVILSEHRLEEAFPLSDRVLVLEAGKLRAYGSPREVGESLRGCLFTALPTPVRVWTAVESGLPCPLTVREGREWLNEWQPELQPLPEVAEKLPGETVLTARELWFRYGKQERDIIRGLSLDLHRGQLLALLGGNGAGKSTLLSLLAGLNKPQRGRVEAGSRVCLLPQNPQALFVKSELGADLQEAFRGLSVPESEQQRRLAKVLRLCRLNHLLHRHPYDLSGGEQQRSALAKVLLTAPEILLLDEPTKGLDADFKQELARILQTLRAEGVTLLMVSHDVEFCAEVADSCALLFNGSIASSGSPRQFFSGNSFYTTAANRMARHLLPQVVTAGELIAACGGQLPPADDPADFDSTDTTDDGDNADNAGNADNADTTAISNAAANAAAKAEQTPARAVIGIIPGAAERRPLNRRTRLAVLLTLLAIPLTLFLGLKITGDRKYLVISLLVLIESMLPFALAFEGRRPPARELVLIAVLCALGVAGRAAFFLLPQFKPVLALVIIAGVALGTEGGFLVGALTMLVSNMFFGQGPWTPWQMFAAGLCGGLAGLLFAPMRLPRRRLLLAAFGAVAAVLLYGLIMNAASVVMFQNYLSWPLFLTAEAAGLPMDLLHALATGLFLLLLAEPMLEKLARVRQKYGLPS